MNQTEENQQRIIYQLNTLIDKMENYWDFFNFNEGNQLGTKMREYTGKDILHDIETAAAFIKNHYLEFI